MVEGQKLRTLVCSELDLGSGSGKMAPWEKNLCASMGASVWNHNTCAKKPSVVTPTHRESVLINKWIFIIWTLPCQPYQGPKPMGIFWPSIDVDSVCRSTNHSFLLLNDCSQRLLPYRDLSWLASLPSLALCTKPASLVTIWVSSPLVHLHQSIQPAPNPGFSVHVSAIS